jgi:hypothetical protein
MSTLKILEFVAELITFIAELAAGDMTIDKARKRAAKLLARKPEALTDLLLAELNARIAEIDAKIEKGSER